MPASLPIEFAGEKLILLGDRAVHWPAQHALMLADVHLGKDASFRAAGLPVPVGNSAKDLGRIETLLSVTKARKLVILGDLIHNKASHQPELADAFVRWRIAHSELEVLLVRGNHDLRAGPTPNDWRITQVPQLFDAGPFIFAHHPQPANKPLLCGHVHPTTSIRDFDGTSASMPCFVVDAGQLMLPAFGSFTGGHAMRPEPGRKMFVVIGKTVISLPAKV